MSIGMRRFNYSDKRGTLKREYLANIAWIEESYKLRPEHEYQYIFYGNKIESTPIVSGVSRVAVYNEKSKRSRASDVLRANVGKLLDTKDIRGVNSKRKRQIIAERKKDLNVLYTYLGGGVKNPGKREMAKYFETIVYPAYNGLDEYQGQKVIHKYEKNLGWQKFGSKLYKYAKTRILKGNNVSSGDQEVDAVLERLPNFSSDVSFVVDSITQGGKMTVFKAQYPAVPFKFGAHYLDWIERVLRQDAVRFIKQAMIPEKDKAEMGEFIDDYDDKQVRALKKSNKDFRKVFNRHQRIVKRMRKSTPGTVTFFFDKLKELLKQQIDEKKNIKVNFEFSMSEFLLDIKRDASILRSMIDDTKAVAHIISFGSFEKDYKAFEDVIYRRFEDVVGMAESYYDFRSADSFYIHDFKLEVYKYDPLRGGHATQKLPKVIYDKKATVNIKNRDNYCFCWSVLRSLFRRNDRNPACLSDLRDKFDSLNIEGLEFPLKVQDVKRFEQMNNIGVNVKYLEERGNKYNVLPLYVSSIDPQSACNLLLWKAHYFPITDMSALLSSQISNNEHHTYICHACHFHTHKESVFDEHISKCDGSNTFTQTFSFPVNTEITYDHTQHYQKQHLHPITIYWDTEAVLVPIEEQTGKSIRFQEHKACTFSAYVSTTIQEFESAPVTFTGENAGLRFIEHIFNIVNLYQIWRAGDSIVTRRCDQSFTACEVCNSSAYNFDKAHEFCVSTWRDRIMFGHRKCADKIIPPQQVSVLAHNSRGYDTHHLIRAMLSDSRLTDNLNSSKIIAMSEEKYLTFELNNVLFRDSIQHLNASLSSLIKEHVSQGNQFESIHRYHPEIYDLVTRKMPYPYNYNNSFERLNSTQFPPKEEFESEDDWRHAKQIYDAAGCNSFADFTSLYCQIDVLQLADIFNKYRDDCIETLKCDPAQYITLPNMSWAVLIRTINEEDAERRQQWIKENPITDDNKSLKVSDIYSEFKLNSLPNQEIFNFFEKSIRGGYSHIAVRYSKANNKYMGDAYDKTKPSKYITVLDINSLYPTAMLAHMPTGNFEMIEDESIKKWFDLTTPKGVAKFLEWKPDDTHGLTLEVDIECPRAVQIKCKEYPLFPTNRQIRAEELSDEHCLAAYDNAFNSDDYSNLDILTKKFGNSALCHTREDKIAIGRSLASKTTKLVADFLPKRNYVVNYRLLQYGLKLGYKVTKVHRMVMYEQLPICRRYIETSARMRKEAQTANKKTIFKLSMNSVYGKSVMSVRKQKQMRIISNKDTFQEFINQPNAVGATAWTDRVAICSSKKSVLKGSHPIQIGSTTLDESKLIMAEFVYEVLVPRYGKNFRILGGDTDSLFLEVTTDDLFADIANMRHEFDLSDTPKNFFVPEIVDKTIEHYSVGQQKLSGMIKDIERRGGTATYKENPCMPYCYQTYWVTERTRVSEQEIDFDTMKAIELTSLTKCQAQRRITKLKDKYPMSKPYMEQQWNGSYTVRARVYKMKDKLVQLYSDENKKELGCMKMESSVNNISSVNDLLAVEFVGVRSKCYSLLYQNGRCKTALKGIKNSEQLLEHAMFRTSVLRNKAFSVEQTNIVSKNHVLHWVKTDKIALNPTNDKVYMLDSVESVPYGYLDMTNCKEAAPSYEVPMNASYKEQHDRMKVPAVFKEETQQPPNMQAIELDARKLEIQEQQRAKKEKAQAIVEQKRLEAEREKERQRALIEEKKRAKLEAEREKEELRLKRQKMIDAKRAEREKEAARLKIAPPPQQERLKIEPPSEDAEQRQAKLLAMTGFQRKMAELREYRLAAAKAREQQ